LIFLCLRIVFNTAFAQLLKMAQARDGHMLPAACVNYIVAALLGGLGLLLFPSPATPQTLSIQLGLATGLTYALSLLGLEVAVRTSGVSIAVAILQLAVLVPTVVSMIAFREQPGPVQGVGIILAVPALWLLTQSRTVATAVKVAPGIRPPSGAAAITLLLLFLVTGCSGILMKSFEVYCPPGDRLAYATALFAVSALVIGGAVVRKRVKWGPLAWPIGTLVGISNLLQLEMTLMALAVLPAIVVFPASSALTVVLSALLSVWFWQERLNARALLGMALAILCAILLNGHR
jgi:drug/metabolite transporter (DMT)-like permease